MPPQFQNSPLITSHHVGLIFRLTAVDIVVSLTAVDKMSCMMPQDHSDVYADKLLVRSYVLSKALVFEAYSEKELINAINVIISTSRIYLVIFAILLL